LVQTFALIVATLVLAATPHASAAAADRPVRIVALGDSLTAGLGLAANEAFPARLEQALRAKGIAVEISNAGVSGDTATGGLARLDWSVPEGTDAVILELGANDMLQGVPVAETEANLDAMLKALTGRHLPVLLAGMKANQSLGADYVAAFDAMYPALAQKYHVPLYPFYLDGVALDPALNQPDLMHPNARGVAIIVNRMLSAVEQLVAVAGK
jgi:acyl-CoA thioesterase-1